MARLNLIQLSGEIPRMLPRLLPDGAAQYAANVRLEDGGLTPIRQARSVATVNGTPGQIKTIYKWLDQWLSWPGIVNCAPGPVAEDRLYYTGDGAPKMLVSGTVYPLAMPTPGVLTATVSGSATDPNVITRLYVHTWVSQFGEESLPSVVSNEVNWQAGQTVTLSGFTAPPAGRGITRERIYRSVTSASGATDLYFIAERDVSTATFVDTIDNSAIGEPLPSRYYNPPPDGLQGLISIPNGMMLGFIGKDLYFCEPWQPHAWPESYMLHLDYNIVALGYVGNQIVVLTDGRPYIVTGTTPDTMQEERVKVNYPCINARGVVDLGSAIVYPTNDGLAIVDGSLPRIVSETLITKKEWESYNPQAFVAGQYNSRYMASYSYQDYDGTILNGTFIIDLSGETPFLMRYKNQADAFYFDLAESELYLLMGVNVFAYDSPGQINEIMNWRSKEFYDIPRNYSCIYIQGSDGLTPEQAKARQNDYNDMLSANATVFSKPSICGELDGAAIGAYAINADLMQHPTAPQFATVNIYADDKLVATVSKMNQMVRLGSGYLARKWEVEVMGTASVEQITLATSPRELFGG